ncbi:MAG: AtpZ/AtpI family protein [Candidatus Hydrogenedentota bacterium]
MVNSNNKTEKKDDDWKIAVLQASSVGFVMVFSVLIGLAIGLWLDKLLRTTPWLMIIGIFIGMFSGFYSIWLIMKEIAKH